MYGGECTGYRIGMALTTGLPKMATRIFHPGLIVDADRKYADLRSVCARRIMIIVVAVLFLGILVVAALSSDAHSAGKSKVDRYFSLIGQIETAKKNRDFHRMLQMCKESIPLLPAVIRSTKRQSGSFDICSIPAISQACIFWGVFGLTDEIKTARTFCGQLKELAEWDYEFEQALKRVALVSRITEYVKMNSGCVQKNLKVILQEEDGAFVSNTLHYMEAAGLLRREKNGNSYALFC